MSNVINLIAYVMMVGVNAYANLKKLGGASTGEISAAYPNVFTPAGITFAIWGAIYGLLAVFLIRTFFSSRAKETAKKIGPWFAISCMFNIAWIFCWHLKKIPLSMAAMLGLFAALVVMRRSVENAALADRAGFELYAGWISLATAANFIVTLVSGGADGFGSLVQVLSFGILIVAGILMMGTVLVDGCWVFGLAAVWGLLGILYRQLDAAQLAGKYPWMVAAALTGAILVSYGVIQAIKDKQKKTGARPALPPLES